MFNIQCLIFFCFFLSPDSLMKINIARSFVMIQLGTCCNPVTHQLKTFRRVSSIRELSMSLSQNAGAFCFVYIQTPLSPSLLRQYFPNHPFRKTKHHVELTLANTPVLAFCLSMRAVHHSLSRAPALILFQVGEPS